VSRPRFKNKPPQEGHRSDIAKRAAEYQALTEVVDKAAAKEKAIAEDPLAALLETEVTEAFVREIEDAKLIHPLVPLSHLVVWAGASGSGKTMLAMHVAADLARKGYRVLYLQEDAPAEGLKWMREHAAQHGYRLLNSTAKLGTGTDDQIALLQELVDAGTDLNGVVFIFDTMKKFLDLMSKGVAREFFKLLRSLTARKATVLALGHTNKNAGADGRPIFEGVGDVRNDVDELLYLTATPPDIGGHVTITVKRDKVRSRIAERQSFRGCVDTHTVMPLEQVVDVEAEMARAEQEKQDSAVLVTFKSVIREASNGINSTELVERVAKRTSAMSSRQVMACFERHCTRDETSTKHLMLDSKGAHNARVITLHPKCPMNRGAVSENAGTDRTAGTAGTAEQNEEAPE
jgi:KaiC/GvpD/RAD55 family RecA-like ATPase